MIEDLSILAEVIGSNSTAALLFNDEKAAQENLAALRVQPHIVSANIFTVDRTIFATYVRKNMNQESMLPKHRKDPSEVLKDGYYSKNNYLELSQRIIFDGNIIGEVHLVSDLDELYFHLKIYAGIFLIIMLVSSGVAYVLSKKLQWVISTPIVQLAKTMKIVSNEKNYAIRVAKRRGNDELGVLNDGFNEMLEQIQMRDEELEQHKEHLETLVVERTF
ncbi:MAG: CHASE sensor domain-containing protein, partial [Thermodesulfobacteriota bacterium]|nr:CHASE sensor domain-containing protein [Thermodesulfobacteriota bacterium]